jgi:hypothetical protein
MTLWGLPARAVLSTPMQRAASLPVLEPQLRWGCLVSPRGVPQARASKVRAAAHGPAQAQIKGLASEAVSVPPPAREQPSLQFPLRGQVRCAEPRPSAQYLVHAVASGSLTGPVTMQLRTRKLLIEPLESI